MRRWRGLLLPRMRHGGYSFCGRTSERLLRSRRIACYAPGYKGGVMSNWIRKVFDSLGLDQGPSEQGTLNPKDPVSPKIYVSSSGYDDIGNVLRSMRVPFESFRRRYDCELLFINCGTTDHVDRASLRRFVHDGGYLYASDLTSSLLTRTFPGMFKFGRKGRAGMVRAKIVDDELRQVAGDSTTIHFDLPDWSVLRGCQGETLVEGAKGAYAGRPLMVKVAHGEGAIFYTSFHNRAQVSEQERVLLQLLVLKQISASSNMTVAQASQSLGISLPSVRKRPEG